MTRKFLLAALVILLAALCTVHLTAERTPPENVVSPAVHLGMVVPREALEKLKAAETAALAAPQTAEPTADVTAEPAEEESLPATDTSVLAAAVTTDALYIRRSGDWDAEALALVDYGTTVAVTGKSGGWYQVRYDGIEGYLSGEYLDLRTSGLTGYGLVTADALNLRSGAGTGYETVTSLPYGAWVSVSRFENGWFYVDYDGVSGYVSGDYLELSASRSQSGGDTSSDTVPPAAPMTCPAAATPERFPDRRRIWWRWPCPIRGCLTPMAGRLPAALTAPAIPCTSISSSGCICPTEPRIS